MTKKIIILSLSILMLAAACKKGSKPVDNSENNSAKKGTEQNARGQGSFKDLMASGKPQKCETSYVSGNITSTGTTYVAGDKMRGDFSSEVEGKTTESHMIIRDQTVYTWIEVMGTTMAFKTSLNTSNASTTQTRSVDINQRVDYNCEDWTVDESMFVLPTGVTFQETSAITPNGAAGNSSGQGPGTSSPGSKAAACAACDNAGEGKAQCLVALQCN